MGRWGAALVNIAVIISLLGATLGHTIMCTECPYEAAKSGAFCKAFTRTNKNGAPVFAIILTSIIAQVFLVLLYFNESTYQVFYFFATGMIMVPYFLSAMYFCKVALKQENGLIKGIGIFNAVYAVWMVFAAGISVMLATVLLYVPGIFVYAKGQKEKGLKVFETKVDKAVFVALLALLVICTLWPPAGSIRSADSAECRPVPRNSAPNETSRANRQTEGQRRCGLLPWFACLQSKSVVCLLPSNAAERR